MKKLLLLLLLSPAYLLAQSETYSGVVRDLITNLPIATVSVSDAAFSVGTVTNDDGNFRLTFPAGTATLHFSHIGYRVHTQPVEALKSADIHLEPMEYSLEEVIVSSVPVDKMLKKMISNSQKHLEKSMLVTTYNREFVKLNGTYTTFADGLMEYNIKKQNGKSDLYLKQTRAMKVNDVKLKKADQNIDGMAMFGITDAIRDAYTFRSLNTLLDNEQYDYMLRNKTDGNGNGVQVVTITPKKDQGENLFSGTIIYDLKTNLILEMDLAQDPENRQYAKTYKFLGVSLTLFNQARKAVFSHQDGKYRLVYNKVNIAYSVKYKDRIDDDFEFMSDIVVLDQKEGEFNLDRSKRYQEKSLFKAGSHYTTEFWKTNNVMLLSRQEEQILASLSAVPMP